MTGVKQSQLLVFKTWTKTGVGQKIQDIKTLGSKNRCSGKNWVKKDKSKKFGEKNLGKKKSGQKEFRSKSFGYKRFLGPKKAPKNWVQKVWSKSDQ